MKSRCPKCLTISNVDDIKIDDIDSMDFIREQLERIEKRKQYLKSAKDDVYRKIFTSTQSINVGFIMERLIPVLDKFNWKHPDCRSTGGDPIDYLIFDGLSAGKVTKIYFVDVKTGEAVLTKRQKEIKDVINVKRNVKFRTFDEKNNL